jgi:CheY-like chemotaxis protein
MLVTALEIDGHEVDEADSASAGLKRLSEARYHLVLSDYAMPGGTGTWMLHEATRRGLMADTVAVIITAHPDVTDLADVEVITKPLDLDFFLEEVRRLLVSRQGGGRNGTAGPGRTDTEIEQTGSGVPHTHKIEFVLYVSSASAASAQAQQNIERLLSQFDASQVKLTICDLDREPLAGTADRIAFTPTLVKTFPEPKMWLVGNLRDPEILMDLLRASGVVAT